MCVHACIPLIRTHYVYACVLATCVAISTYVFVHLYCSNIKHTLILLLLCTECLQLMIEKNTSPTSSRPIPSLTGNATISAISAGSHTAITETTSVTITSPIEETSSSQQNGTVSCL